MANVKISALGTLSSVSDSTILPVVDGGTTQKIVASTLKTYIGAGSSYGNTQVIANLQYLTTPVTTTNTVTADKVITTNNGNGTNFKVGDDAWIGDVNIANTMRVAGQEDGTQGYIIFGNTNNTQYIGRSGIGPITTTGDFAVTGTSYFANISTGNIVQGLGTQITTPSGTNGNITFNPDGTGYVVFTNITPVLMGNTLQVRDVRDTVYTISSGSNLTTGTITPDASNGDLQVLNLTGSITFNGFNNPIAGQTVTFAVVQPNSGGPYTLTSSMKFAGGNKTLSTAANAVDLVTITYVNSTIGYLGSIVTGFA
jgi:cold shock CspA family protein